MEQIVRVKQVHSDGSATVLHMRQSACSGDCHKCSGCGAAQEAIELTARNLIGAETGDFVTVEAATGPVLKAAAMLYMVPMALFFLGYLLGALAWQRGGLTGCLAFVLGICLAVVYDRLVVKKQNTGYTITGFAGESLMKHMRKGEHDID